MDNFRELQRAHRVKWITRGLLCVGGGLFVPLLGLPLYFDFVLPAAALWCFFYKAPGAPDGWLNKGSGEQPLNEMGGRDTKD